MTAAADLILYNGDVHVLTDTATPADPTHSAVAIRDGRIVGLSNDYDAAFRADTGTREVDLGGRVVVPGFVDAHTHLAVLGKHGVHADLRGADSPAAATARLAERARETDAGWVLGFGYDDSQWSAALSTADLDAVSEARPVAAIREDMHTATVNGVALAEHGDEMPAADVGEDGRIVEDAVEAVYDATDPDLAGTRPLIEAAQREANERGVTAVHEMVRDSHAPRVYRELDAAGELSVRVRLNYWADHLDAVLETGLVTNHGGGMVTVGGIKTYTDGSLGGRTAKLSEPYADAPGETGQWVVDPSALAALVERADDAGLQVIAHAIGDAAVDAVLDAYEDAGERRHRIEHAELASDDAIERMADLGVVASVQPNFLKWAGSGGLYADRLGTARREASNRFADMLDAGVDVAFGSDCMPLAPLVGVHHAVTAPADAQRLSVTAALRAYTSGGARAGCREDEQGVIREGALADLTVLDASPWEHADAIADEVGVSMTVVDGAVVYDGR
ncbi:amidohydrolase [Halobacterium salinarum]|uniref:amidohydrolase n=1 Tax=Halobacterium salinarum TaxID=2242 RepID=UPI001F318AE7|nr:amidohydrolase [Halobacterium salinarum]MCF2207305.1 amidohydrolase [Halobacterium salinarum]MCF2240328.1 amidohydrolase [Halobacterium salinarum]MDL0128971.1 amidohydrolase [Halobacterium salinarum]MDL0132714.1 amidohydrolase [Halobacterium salinarum]